MNKICLEEFITLFVYQQLAFGYQNRVSNVQIDFGTNIIFWKIDFSKSDMLKIKSYVCVQKSFENDQK